MQFVLGPPGSGKTARCLDEINKLINGQAPLYYLVPEQFSLQSERLLLRGRSAQTRVQVLSFNRLAHRLFATFGGPPGLLADDLGKQMLLRKLLTQATEELSYYRAAVEKPGFVDSLARSITEMNHYRVTAADLRLAAETAPNTLRAKLLDMAVLLDKYKEIIKNRYLLTDELPEILCSKLDGMRGEAIPLLDGAYFFVDGFAGFTPQERQVLHHINARAAALTITLTTRDRKDFTDALSATPRETIDKLTRSCPEVKPHIYMEENHRHAPDSGLAHFVRNFAVYGKMAAFNEPPDIEIIATQDKYAAVYAAANYIQTAVQQHGWRFSDIAILCSNRQQYEKILHTTFDRLNIPVFVDTEVDILSHPLTELIRAALDIVMQNFSFDSVFRFLKTRLTAMDADTMDILENYALEHGITSYRWRYPMDNTATGLLESSSPAATKAEAGRLQLLAALGPFCKPGTRPDRVATVEAHSRRIFDMLYALKIPDVLQNWFTEYMEAGDPATARLHKQIWPKCCQVFDKLVEILGDERVTLKTFQAMLEAGFAQVGLGRIPPTTNQVILGDITRSRYPEIKMMLVLGANDGQLPPAPGQDGLLTDLERKFLHCGDIEIAPQNASRVDENFYNLYCALSQPKQRLLLIYAENEPGGTAPLRPASIIKRICELFPNLAITQAGNFQEYGQAPAPPSMPQKLTANLPSGNLITAASRLESYACCPFQYFVHYMLTAAERKRFQVLPADLGSLYHDVIAEFSKLAWELPDQNRPRLQLSDAATALETPDIPGITQIVNEIVTALTAEQNLYNLTARNRHILTKVRRVATQTIWALCQHLERGDFAPVLSEASAESGGDITLPDGRRLILTGRVDRVDALIHRGSEYLKIIDYKSGSTKFDPDEARAGVQLQLMLYMDMLTRLRAAKPGGVFYFHINDPILDTDKTLDDFTREEGLLKMFKMSGIAVSDEAVLQGLDRKLAPGIESSIISVGVKKDGDYKKTSRIMDAASFAALGNEVTEKIKQLGQGILDGEIPASPYKNGRRSPCDFCKYKGICKM
ncbi:MAG: PD-(D/E)XK nuclease family protein [Defluviitaleaceae bacterium]|nr:PD-(D/E)XK nuclease family protein [Defluviitaleaceae bacterium]